MANDWRIRINKLKLVTALVHGACLRSGREAPDMNLEGELVDDLRAEVMDELLRGWNDFDQW
ncbi:hypothetical protein C5167_001455 [Papaver somniferum]|uniref:Uncharacterized protein n=1 Tax=Papaver somniferum TaxID=3469 RepID=A0A4Y7KX09_PAPSO|nr:hypothetical protein C5167_001455 [Papaver somniferum]